MDANGLKSQPSGGFIPVGKNLVFGKTIDGLTRCVHWSQSLVETMHRFSARLSVATQLAGFAL